MAVHDEEYYWTMENDLKRLVDQLLDRTKEQELDYSIYGYPDDWLSAPDYSYEDDEESIDALKAELDNMARYAKNYVDWDVDKDSFKTLKEAVKCPVLRKQFHVIDLGYTKVKITTEHLFRILKKNILNRNLRVNANSDGFYVRITKKMLQDNVGV